MIITIRTTSDTLTMERSHLRTITKKSFPFRCDHGKPQYLTFSEYYQLDLPVATFHAETPAGSFRAMSEGILLTECTGKTHLILTGYDSFWNDEVYDLINNWLLDLTRGGDPMLDLSVLKEDTDAPYPYHTTKLLSGEEAYRLLALVSNRRTKYIRCQNQQRSFAPETEVVKTHGFSTVRTSICDPYEPGPISREAFQLLLTLPNVRCFSTNEFEEDEYNPHILRICHSYYIHLHANNEDHLILAGFTHDDCERVFNLISDGFSSEKRLIDLSVPEADDAFIPQFMSHAVTPEILRFIYEIGGESPSIP